jgi:HEPN domain-containing protein
MKQNTKSAQKFIKLAQRDLKAFQALLQHDDISITIILFHAQQTTEKLMKAILSFYNVEVQKTHDLLDIHDLLVKNLISFPFQLSILKNLNPYAVTFRYDDREIADVDVIEIQDFLEKLFQHTKCLAV